MIPQLISDIKFNIYFGIFSCCLIMALCLFEVYNCIIKKKNILPYDNTNIIIFGKKTTILNIISLLVIVIIIIFAFFTNIHLLKSYKVFKNGYYLDGNYVLLNTFRNGKYGDRTVKIENLTTNEEITGETFDKIIATKKEIGSCYYVQIFEPTNTIVFGKKIDCVTKETLESYCDLDVCK